MKGFVLCDKLNMRFDIHLLYEKYAQIHDAGLSLLSLSSDS